MSTARHVPPRGIDRHTHVGRGTPGGDYLRRFWHINAASSDRVLLMHSDCVFAPGSVAAIEYAFDIGFRPSGERWLEQLA